MSTSQALHLAPDLIIPPDAVTRTFGILAVRGAGKSNTAAVMAEEMFAAGLPFVVIDPVGSWYGLRSSADGTAPGLPIPIFGGKHGDVPLERGAGELIADLVVEKRLTCVLDLSRFDSEADKKHFLLTFARRLYLKNENPLHLFLEEADDYIPQSPMGDEKQLLRAWENIVRRGRARGLGMTLITQRSAAVAKMVLTQVETLFAMRTTGPQDIEAIKAWIQYHQVGKEVLASLASLEDGEAWVWSPHYLKTMTRHQIRRRSTFDSGATPKNVRAKDTRPPATLADIDLSAIETQIATTIEKAKADDPRELRKQIADLKRQVASGASTSTEVVKQKVPVLTDADRALLETVRTALADRAAAARDTISVADARLTAQVEQSATEYLNTVRKVGMAAALDVDQTLDGAGLRAVLDKLPGRSSVAPRPTEPRAPRVADRPGLAGLDNTQQAILDVVAMLGVRGIDANRESVARWLDIHPNGGRYGSNLARLREEGYLAGFALTAKGARAARALPTGFEAAKTPLDGPQQQILDILATDGGRFTRETLAHALGLHPNGGRYGSNLARLRIMGLIPDRGDIYLTEGARR